MSARYTLAGYVGREQTVCVVFDVYWIFRMVDVVLKAVGQTDKIFLYPRNLDTRTDLDNQKVATNREGDVGWV